jgi:hypothetical protein
MEIHFNVYMYYGIKNKSDWNKIVKEKKKFLLLSK